MPRRLIEPKTVGDLLLARNLRTRYRTLGNVEHWARDALGWANDPATADWLLELAERCPIP